MIIITIKCIVYIIQALDEQTAYLKDQLQELKARTGLETKYIKKQTQVSTWYVSTQPTSGSSAISCLEPCAVQPAAASAQWTGVDWWERQTATTAGRGEESSWEHSYISQETHWGILLLYKQRLQLPLTICIQFFIQSLESKVEHWMAKYEDDLDMKTKEVQDLKVNSTHSSWHFMCTNICHGLSSSISPIRVLFQPLAKFCFSISQALQNAPSTTTQAHYCWKQ